MRYLVKARVKSGRKESLLQAIDQQTLGRGSIAGDEYQHDMKQARVDSAGVATWVETCFCDPPLDEERPYWEKYFELLAVKDAHSRRNAGMKTARKRGPAAIALAPRSSRKSCKGRASWVSRESPRERTPIGVME